MPLLVIAPGPLATVQDQGRVGYRGSGVPVSGAFDRGGMALANALLGNEPDVAVVELTGFGGVFEAGATLALALAGAAMTARVEPRSGADRVLNPPQATTLRTGDRLVLGRASVGHRAYLAVRGGWRVRLILGSRSSEVPIAAGDRLPADPGATPGRRPGPGLRPPEEVVEVVRYLDAPDATRLGAGGLDARSFRVGARSDRMGLRLEGEPLDVRSDANADASRLSAPVAPGSIQVAGGLPIVLGPACGTMGGYPHVAQVISADLDRLGQLRPGATVRFLKVALDEARWLDRRYRNELARRCLIVGTAVGDDPWR